MRILVGCLLCSAAAVWIYSFIPAPNSGSSPVSGCTSGAPAAESQIKQQLFSGYNANFNTEVADIFTEYSLGNVTRCSFILKYEEREIGPNSKATEKVVYEIKILDNGERRVNLVPWHQR
jgi:hypothetical protein